jgi:hypothetical protein
VTRCFRYAPTSTMPRSPPRVRRSGAPNEPRCCCRSAGEVRDPRQLRRRHLLAQVSAPAAAPT